MAPSRAFSFPLSHAEESARIEPFAISKRDVTNLQSCEAFQIIRGLLVDRDGIEFCGEHFVDSPKDKEAWLLQRDITYALIVPVLEIYRLASDIAKALLGSRHVFDLELVFRGEARGVFSWLQCFVMDEEDWCLTRGCPGCVVTHVLQAEPTIRMVLVACHLSESLHRQKQSDTSHLPLFDFWSQAMKKALDEDPFWGPQIWKNFQARAEALETGIEELVRQCIELAPLALSAVKDDQSPPASPKYNFPQTLRLPMQEQQTGVSGIVAGCWTTLLADATEARRRRNQYSQASQPVLERYLTA
ncbi:MAG: hypothetical protein Q9222_004875 [Ikaeria aurantiellina]